MVPCARYLSHLGSALQTQFEHGGHTETLDEAIGILRDALAATNPTQPIQAMYMINLGRALQLRFEHGGPAEALEEAVELSRDAVAATSTTHPNHALYLNHLGAALQTQFGRSGHRAVLHESVECFRSAGSNEAAAVTTRIRAWRAATAVGGILEQNSEALAAAEEAVALLPLVLPQSLVRADRQHRLGGLGSLAGVVAAAATGAGNPSRAVTLLEQTRGLLVADTLAARSTDMHRLAEIAPSLAEDLVRVRARLDALEQPRSLGGIGMSHRQGPEDVGAARLAANDLAHARVNAAADWDALVLRVRDLDGFQDFLAPPRASDLAAQARQGPVVFVTANATRCDALVLTDRPDHPVHLVPLTALSETSAYQQVRRLRVAHRTATDPAAAPDVLLAAQTSILDVLAWLWDTVTEPVLGALAHTRAPASVTEWPRIWWCPVGIMAYLPLHAAGHHADLTTEDSARRANPRTVLDRVVSSYTTTVRGLAYARTHHTDTIATAPLIVAVPEIAGAASLPGVHAEAAALTALMPGATTLSDPTRDAVLTALTEHPIAHFACHGLADWNDPAGSRLILPDHLTDPLTVADISALHLTGGLAYLSACDTTSTSPDLADEAVHITGAFHLAGYEHVVGTLWPVNDNAARRIAQTFYRRITADGATPPDVTRSAEALHHAVRDLRARHPATPTLWAAHTHTGS